MFGYSRSEAIGHSTLELAIWAKPEDRERVKQLLKTQGNLSNCEFEFCNKSGEMFSGLFAAEIIHLRDKPCLLKVITDITPLKQAEKALAKLAEIGELAATIVHKVRNPLTTVLMGLNSFKRLELTPKYQEYLTLALAEAERLQRLLNQILLYAKPQTLKRSPLQLNNFITEMLPALESMPYRVILSGWYSSNSTITLLALENLNSSKPRYHFHILIRGQTRRFGLSKITDRT